MYVILWSLVHVFVADFATLDLSYRSMVHHFLRRMFVPIGVREMLKHGSFHSLATLLLL